MPPTMSSTRRCARWPPGSPPRPRRFSRPTAGVPRTGGAALRSAAALADHVLAPAVQDAGLDPRVVQLVRSADREAAVELVRQPGLIPLVILRGSGETTRSLAAEAARAGGRTLPPPDGGGG